jgi:hypothetical protein
MYRFCPPLAEVARFSGPEVESGNAVNLKSTPAFDL